MGGHQEGYTRPPYPGNSKIYVDQELIKGKGKMMTWWALQQLPDQQQRPAACARWSCSAARS